MLIFIADDDADTRRGLERLLESHGHVTESGGTVAESVRFLLTGLFDLYVTDIMFADGTGWDLIDRLRGRVDTPGIVLSGFARPEDVRRSEELGFRAHLGKPGQLMSLPELINAVRGGDTNFTDLSAIGGGGTASGKVTGLSPKPG